MELRHTAPYLVTIRLFSEGVRALPLFAPFNASLDCWKTLTIRRREFFKGFGWVKPKPYQIKAVTYRLSA